MTTLNELLEALASELNSRLTNWDVLAEIPENEILENIYHNDSVESTSEPCL